MEQVFNYKHRHATQQLCWNIVLLLFLITSFDVVARGGGARRSPGSTGKSYKQYKPYGQHGLPGGKKPGTKGLDAFLQGQQPGLLVPHPAETAEAKEKKRVQEIQESLSRLGYYTKISNGVMGFETGEAIRRFQKEYELEVTGKDDSTTVRMLRESSRLQEAVNRAKKINPESPEIIIGVKTLKEKSALYLPGKIRFFKKNEIYSELAKYATARQSNEISSQMTILLSPSHAKVAQVAAIEMNISLITMAPQLNPTIRTLAEERESPPRSYRRGIRTPEQTLITRRPLDTITSFKSKPVFDNPFRAYSSVNATDRYQLGYGRPFDIQYNRYSTRVIHFLTDLKERVRTYFAKHLYSPYVNPIERETSDLTNYIFDKFKSDMHDTGKPSTGSRYHIEFLKDYKQKLGDELVGIKVVELVKDDPHSLAKADDP